MDPTASAVVADCIELCRSLAKAPGKFDRRKGRRLPSGAYYSESAPGSSIMSMSDIKSQYYLRLIVRDRPGVLSRVAGLLSKEKISISQVIQRGPMGGSSVPIVMMTHQAKESSIKKALAEIKRLNVVIEPAQMMRIETGF
jgi:homoserine dehydrogenase